jgi:hypothetical protein
MNRTFTPRLGPAVLERLKAYAERFRPQLNRARQALSRRGLPARPAWSMIRLFPKPASIRWAFSASTAGPWARRPIANAPCRCTTWPPKGTARLRCGCICRGPGSMTRPGWIGPGAPRGTPRLDQGPNRPGAPGPSPCRRLTGPGGSGRCGLRGVRALPPGISGARCVLCGGRQRVDGRL